jgi:hypothetical protein
MKIDSDVLSIAAEFGVASELGRRNIYAQPTFGHRKRTDLLVFGRSGKVVRLEVKGKQDKQWPSCTGIPDENTVLVLVDFQGKKESERPDFYVLTLKDWRGFVKREIVRRGKSEKIELNKENCPIWRTRIKNGKPHYGINVEVEYVQQHRERWDKITQALQ